MGKERESGLKKRTWEREEDLAKNKHTVAGMDSLFLRALHPRAPQTQKLVKAIRQRSIKPKNACTKRQSSMITADNTGDIIKTTEKKGAEEKNPTGEGKHKESQLARHKGGGDGMKTQRGLQSTRSKENKYKSD